MVKSAHFCFGVMVCVGLIGCAIFQTESGDLKGIVSDRRIHGVEKVYANENSDGKPVGTTFWIEYTLDTEKMTFTADWGYETGTGENGVVGIPVSRTSAGWNAIGISRSAHFVCFEQDQEGLRMEWGQRVEKVGPWLHQVSWPDS